MLSRQKCKIKLDAEFCQITAMSFCYPAKQNTLGWYAAKIEFHAHQIFSEAIELHVQLFSNMMHL
jgi:hypothetical protein